jgi:DNA replication protein DnaC
VFVSSPDLLDYLRSSFSSNTEGDESGNYASRFEEIRSAPLLILDDLGVESPTLWASEKLYQIINYRYLSRLPTVITTSHHLEELEARLQSRLADIDLTQIVAITAQDFRGSGVGRGASIVKDTDLYRNMTLDSFKERRDLPAGEQENLRKALEVTRQYAENPEGWLILIGGYGTGKTHLIAAIANAQAERFDGVETLFLTVPDLLDHLRATFAPESRISYDKLFDEVRSARLLILDDLELSSATPWAREKLHQILNYRYHGRLPTVITSAHRLEEITEMDPRLAIRFRDQRLCKVVALVVQPYLGERRKNAQSAR